MKRIKRAIGIVCSLSLIGPDIAAANTLEISGGDLFVPQRIASSAKLSFEDGQFTAILDGKSKSINKDDIRDLPKDLTADQLTGFLNAGGYLALGQIGDDLSLTGKLRLRGGIIPAVVGAAVAGATISSAGAIGAALIIAHSNKSKKPCVYKSASKPKPKPRHKGKRRR